MDEPGDDGVLVLAGTPLGDVGDAPARLGREIGAADVVAAEDTRRLRRLCGELGVVVPGEVISFFEGNEGRRTPELVERMQAGARVLVLTDAGMPSVSDPGYRLVAACAAAGIRVTAVPGPSAVTTALAVSGLATDRFCFEGFLPRRAGERDRRLAELATEPRTQVFFESPRRLAATLTAMAAAYGADRPAAVCRELTKTYEEVRRGALGELATWAIDVRGEITLVVAGADPVRTTEPADLAELVAAAEQRGLSRRDAVREVASSTGAGRRDVYEAALHTSPPEDGA